VNGSIEQATTGLPAWVKWVFLLTGIGLPIGWAIAALVDWDHIVDSHARLGYLIGDVGLVTPLCFATWHGLRRDLRWARPVFMFTLGALAYDLVHFGVYLVQEDFTGAGWAWGLLCAALLAVIAWLVWLALRPILLPDSEA
jgi:hypothetical protein